MVILSLIFQHARFQFFYSRTSEKRKLRSNNEIPKWPTAWRNVRVYTVCYHRYRIHLLSVVMCVRYNIVYIIYIYIANVYRGNKRIIVRKSQIVHDPTCLPLGELRSPQPVCLISFRGSSRRNRIDRGRKTVAVARAPLRTAG